MQGVPARIETGSRVACARYRDDPVLVDLHTLIWPGAVIFVRILSAMNFPLCVRDTEVDCGKTRETFALQSSFFVCLLTLHISRILGLYIGTVVSKLNRNAPQRVLKWFNLRLNRVALGIVADMLTNRADIQCKRTELLFRQQRPALSVWHRSNQCRSRC